MWYCPIFYPVAQVSIRVALLLCFSPISIKREQGINQAIEGGCSTFLNDFAPTKNVLISKRNYDCGGGFKPPSNHSEYIHRIEKVITTKITASVCVPRHPRN